MKHDLKTPCVNCPFRKNIEPFLRKERAREISSALMQDKSFQCHKTIDLPNSKHQHCAGAMIMLEKIERPNQMMRISERLGLYDRSKLKMDEDVFDDFQDFIDAQRK